MSHLRSKVSNALKRLLRKPVPASEQPGKVFHYPALEQEWVENAKLCAGRENLLRHFAPQLARGVVAEVGVMYGDFSEFILRAIDPSMLIAIDRFDAHNYPTIWGEPSDRRFKGMTHLDYFEHRFANDRTRLRCEQGDSWECLSRYPDRSFDMIYVDAGHDYQSVKKDAEEAQRKIKATGLIFFNDYIKYSHFDDCYYGVIPVVHEMVAGNGFEVAGFALQPDMYCDIAIRMRGTETRSS